LTAATRAGIDDHGALLAYHQWIAVQLGDLRQVVGQDAQP
jgi:hypothetical protein